MIVNTGLFVLLFLTNYPCLAYLGPGTSGGVIAAIFGIIAAFFLGLWGILYYPIKRAYKNRNKKKKKDFKSSKIK